MPDFGQNRRRAIGAWASAPVRDTPISGRRVVRRRTDLIAERDKPGMSVSDNCTELTSNAVLAWCGEIGVEGTYCPGQAEAERLRRELQRSHVRRSAP